MSKRSSERVTHISATAAALCAEAGVNVSRLDRKFDRKLAKNHYSVLGPKDYFCRKIRERTNVPIWAIYRNHLTIQFRIEWRSTNCVDYYEHTRKQCEISFPQDIPATILAQSIGRPVSDLIAGMGPIGSLQIVDAKTQPWTLLTVKQEWLPVR